jgi:hypothetical protein
VLSVTADKNVWTGVLIFTIESFLMDLGNIDGKEAIHAPSNMSQYAKTK